MEESLWTFECGSHGEFDVWGTDWSDVDPLDRPLAMRDGGFEPHDVTKTRCPRCLKPASPKGPRESWT